MICTVEYATKRSSNEDWIFARSLSDAPSGRIGDKRVYAGAKFRKKRHAAPVVNDGPTDRFFFDEFGPEET